MGLVKRCPSAEIKAGLKVCHEHNKARLLSAVLLLTVGLYACGSKKVVSNAPPPPPPPAPVATIDVSPSTVQAGQTTLITWETQNATEVRIEPLGVVEANGSKEVSPTDSTTYRLFAKGPGGVQGASIRVTVTTAAVALSAEEDLLASRGGRQDIFFDTDAFSIRPDQKATVRDDVEFLKQHPDLNIAIEGHCDELGSTEYNLALGASRASEFKSELVNAGVDGKRIETVSYGKERPFCSESNEDCWKQNRRAHVVAVNHR